MTARFKALFNSRLFAFASAVLIALMLIALGEAFIYTQKGQGEKRHHLDLISYAGEVRARIESEINALLYLSSGLGGYLIVRNNNLEPNEINDILAVLHKSSRFVKNFGVAIGYQLRFVYPLAGNEKAIGLDYSKEPTQWPMIKKTITSGQPNLAGPIDLVQGGQGLIYRVPLFVDGQYWGLLSTVIDAERLFAAIFSSLVSERYDYAMRGKDGTGMDGELIAGNPTVFENPGAVTQRIETPGGHWVLGVARRAPAPDGFNPVLTRLASVLLGALIAWMLYVLLRHRSELEYLVLFDTLTGLPNRRLLEDRAAIACSRQKRKPMPGCTLLFLDLDGFKAINDQHGHKAGDEVLRVIAQRIRESLRGCDTAARWGGDEFILLLEDCSGAAIAAFIERLRQRIECPVRFDDADLCVGLSIGMASYPQQGRTLDALLQVADLAMYQNKDKRKANTHLQALG